MPRAYDKYAAPRSYEKYAQQAPVERQAVQVGDDTYTGTPEMIAAFHAAGDKDPEAAGLAVEGRKRTWRDTAKSLSQLPARVAVPILGGTLGSVVPYAGTVAGSAAAGGALETLLNKAGVGEEGETAQQAGMRGLGEGAVMGLVPGFAKAGQAVGGGVARGLLGQTAGKLGGFAGEAAGAALPGALVEGRLPTTEELALSGGLTGAARGISKLLPKAATLPTAVTPRAGTLREKAAKLGEDLQKPQRFAAKDVEYRKALTRDQAAAAKALEANQSSEALLTQLTPAESELTAAGLRTRVAAKGVADESAALLGPAKTRIAAARSAKTGLDEELRTAQAAHSGSAAELERAKQSFSKRLQQEADEAEPALREALKKGEYEVTGKSFLQTTGGRETRQLGARKSTSDFGIPYETYRPDLITAESYGTYPKLRKLAQEVWGPTFLSDIGSHGMANSTKLLNQYVRQNTSEAVKGKGKEWSEKLAKLMLGDEDLRKFIDPDALSAVKAVAAGQGTAQSGKQFFTAFETALKGRATSPELQAARGAFAETNLALKEARAGRAMSPEAKELAEAMAELRSREATVAQSSKAADLARQRNELERVRNAKTEGTLRHAESPQERAAVSARQERAGTQLAKSQAMAERSAVYGDMPYKSPIRVLGESFGGRFLGAATGAEIGERLAGTPGRLVGRLAGYGVGASGQLLTKAMANAGGVLRAVATAPPGVRSQLRIVEHYAKVKGEKAALAALHVAAKSSPDVQQWIEELASKE